MLDAITLDATTDAGTLEDLAEAIRLRVEYFKTSASDAFIATAINILASLKKSTTKAPTNTVPEPSYKIVATNLFGGLYREKGQPKPKICARAGGPNGPRSAIRPAIGFAPGAGAAKRSRVYAIYTTNPYDTFEKNINAPHKCWYVLCEHEGQAIAYAENHVKRILSKESGMAKYTLGIAQSQASSRGNQKSLAEAVGNGGMSPRAVTLAYNASEIQIDDTGFAEGNISVTFFDALNYSEPAAGGETALTAAIEAATKKTVGYIEKTFDVTFDNFHDRDFKTSRAGLNAAKRELTADLY